MAHANSENPEQTAPVVEYQNDIHPDQTAPEGAVWLGCTSFWYSTKYFKKQLPKKENLGKQSME